MTNKKFIRCFLALTYCLLLWGSAHADSPDAGAIQRQTESALPLKPMPAEIRKAVPAPARETGEDSTTVTVRRFVFRGNERLKNEALTAAVASYLDRPLQFVDLQMAAESVAQAYRNEGWLVRAFLPRQEISDGEVLIQIIESKFGEVRMSGTPPTRVESGRLIAIAAASLAKGEAVNSKTIDRILLILDDLPGVTVTGNFAEGAQDGETDLIISAADEALLAGSVGLDRNGGRATGQERLQLNMIAASPLKLADALALNLLKSEGSQYVRLAYSLPVGEPGMRAGIHGSTMEYRLLREFAATNANGTASNVGFDMSYSWVRSAAKNLSVSLAIDNKQFINKSGTNPLSDYESWTTMMGVFGNHYDGFGGGGTSSFSASLTAGRLDLQGHSANTYGTEGDFVKGNLTLLRQQIITKSVSLNLQGNVQIANKNLDSSEKIYLGGSNGIRAFPSNEGGATNGAIANIELRNTIDERWQWSVFYDHGYLQQYQNNRSAGGGSLTPNNAYQLAGAGLALTAHLPGNVDMQVVYARRTMANPAANAATGADSDGTRILDRFWLSISKMF